MQRQTRYQAAILENHRILLLRIEEQDDSFWVIPGGGQEDSESEEECVIREVQEETHLQVERLIFHDKARPPDLVYQQYKTYLCRIVGGVARPGVEPELGEAESPIKDIGWFDLRAVDSWDWHNSSPSFALILLTDVTQP